MAGNATANRKAELMAELHRSREALSESLVGLRGDLDVGRHLRQSFTRSRTGWLTGAAVTGMVLSALPFLKKKKKKEPRLMSLPFFNRRRPDPVEESAKGGLLLAILGIVASLLKPVLTTFVTRKLTAYATGLNGQHRNGNNGVSHVSRR